MAFKSLVEKYIKKCDYFGKPISLSLNKKPSYKTLYGGLTTIIIVVFSVSMSYGYVRSLINGEDPIFISYSSTDDYTPMINVNNSHFFIAVRLEDQFGTTVEIDPTKFEVEYNYLAYVKEPQNRETSLKLLYAERHFATERCSLKNANNDTSYFVSQELQQFFCFNFTKNYLIGGDWTSNSIAEVVVRVKKCSKYTEQRLGIKCNKSFVAKEDFYVGLKTSNYQVDPYNLANIYQHTSDYYYVMISEQSKRTLLVSLGRTNITEDKGFIATDLSFTSIVHAMDVYFDHREVDINYSSQTGLDNNYAIVTFALSRRVKIYKRSFSRIQDLVSTMGGFISLLSFAIEGVYKMYLYFDYRDYLFNSIFDFYFKPEEDVERNYVPKRTLMVSGELGLKLVTIDKFHDNILKIQSEYQKGKGGTELKAGKNKYLDKNKQKVAAGNASGRPIRTSHDSGVSLKMISDNESITNIKNVKDRLSNLSQNYNPENKDEDIPGKVDHISEIKENNKESLDGSFSDSSKEYYSSEASRNINRLIALNQEAAAEGTTVLKIRNRRSTNFIQGIYEYRKKQDLFKLCTIQKQELFLYKFFFCKMKREQNGFKTKQIIKLAQYEVYSKTDLKNFIANTEQIALFKNILLNKSQCFMLEQKEKQMIYNKYKDEDEQEVNDKLLEEKLKIDYDKKVANLINYLQSKKEKEDLDATDLLLFENLRRELKNAILEKNPTVVTSGVASETPALHSDEVKSNKVFI